MEVPPRGDSTIEARKNLLEDQERLTAKIIELQERLATINIRIEDYYDDLLPKTTEIVNRMKEEIDK
ncbi:hypothetical protein [Enterococcus rotai]|uniref:hypothetical protein n=1 Tax=Enterococcus rotai TaxID=118060 RepID=UPI0032B4677A